MAFVGVVFESWQDLLRNNHASHAVPYSIHSCRQENKRFMSPQTLTKMRGAISIVDNDRTNKRVIMSDYYHGPVVYHSSSSSCYDSSVWVVGFAAS